MLLAKHVDGMHANEDMAFQTDFEDIHNARLMRRTGNAAAAVDGGYNAVAASTFPDVLNGGSGKLSFRSANLRHPIKGPLRNLKAPDKKVMTSFQPWGTFFRPFAEIGAMLSTPVYVDGWRRPNNFICLLNEAPFASEITWSKLVWEQNVGIIVSLLTANGNVSWKSYTLSRIPAFL